MWRQTASLYPTGAGTKAAAHDQLDVPGGGARTIRLRLIDPQPRATPGLFGSVFDEVFALRIREADESYRSITPTALSPDEALVMRPRSTGGYLGLRA